MSGFPPLQATRIPGSELVMELHDRFVMEQGADGTVTVHGVMEVDNRTVRNLTQDETDLARVKGLTIPDGDVISRQEETVDEFRDKIILQATEMEINPGLPMRNFRFIYRHHLHRIQDLTFVTKTELGAYVIFLEKMEKDDTTAWESASWRRFWELAGPSYGKEEDIDGYINDMIKGSCDLMVVEEKLFYFSTGSTIKAAGRR